MTPRTREILHVYFAADLNAALAAARIGCSPERVRQIVRNTQDRYGCTRIDLAKMVDPWVAPVPRRRARQPEGQEALW